MNTLDSIMSEVIKFYARRYDSKLSQVWLFGSKARSDDEEDSDTDVMVVVNDDILINDNYDEQKSDFALFILTKYSELLSIKIATQKDFMDEPISLYKNIKKEGILYYER